jgi:hypothetical protein
VPVRFRSCEPGESGLWVSQAARQPLKRARARPMSEYCYFWRGQQPGRKRPSIKGCVGGGRFGIVRLWQGEAPLPEQYGPETPWSPLPFR